MEPSPVLFPVVETYNDRPVVDTLADKTVAWVPTRAVLVEVVVDVAGLSGLLIRKASVETGCVEVVAVVVVGLVVDVELTETVGVCGFVRSAAVGGGNCAHPVFIKVI